MAIDYYKLQSHRLDLVLDKCTDGGGDREELLKAVWDSEQ